MPTDDHPAKLLLQTDIVGTAGSSGSPIVDPNTGEVVAIAQRVISAPIRESKESHSFMDAIAAVGLVHGISCGAFYDFAIKYEIIRKNPGQISLKVKHPRLVSRSINTSKSPEDQQPISDPS
jgi:hypothetical protein